MVKFDSRIVELIELKRTPEAQALLMVISIPQVSWSFLWGKRNIRFHCLNTSSVRKRCGGAERVAAAADALHHDASASVEAMHEYAVQQAGSYIQSGAAKSGADCNV